MNSHHLPTGIAALLFCMHTLSSAAEELKPEYIIPKSTHSPDGHYGVTLPVVSEKAGSIELAGKNQVIDLHTQKVVAVIEAEPAYDRNLNHHTTLPPHWSRDSSLLLWEVGGKWCPDALVLLKLEQNKAKWQIDLLHTAQQAVLKRTKKAAPKRYAAGKKANAGNGSAYPDGFTIDVNADCKDAKLVSLPLVIHADLTSNPKAIEDIPNLDSHLDAIVTQAGEFKVTDFALGPRKPNPPTP